MIYLKERSRPQSLDTAVSGTLIPLDFTSKLPWRRKTGFMTSVLIGLYFRTCRCKCYLWPAFHILFTRYCLLAVDFGIVMIHLDGDGKSPQVEIVRHLYLRSWNDCLVVTLKNWATYIFNLAVSRFHVDTICISLPVCWILSLLLTWFKICLCICRLHFTREACKMLHSPPPRHQQQ